MFSSRRRRRCDRSSSTTLSSPRKNNYRKPDRQRLDRYGMKRTFKRSDDDDQNPSRRYSRTRTQSYKMNRMSPTTSRRRIRSQSSEFEDFRRKHSPLKKFRSSRRPRTNSSESDNYRHLKYPVSKIYGSKRHSRRSPSYPRSRRSNSSDSNDYRYNKRPVSKRFPSHSRKPFFLGRKRFSSSSDSRDSRHHRRPASVIKKRKSEEMNNSDVDILEGKRLKTKCCRSSPVSKIKSDVKRSDQISKSNMHSYYEKSGKYMEEGKLKKAMKGIDLALELCRKDDKFLSQIYSRRGTIYALLEKPRCTFQGFLDWEHAVIIDKENTEARKNMSKVLFMGANKYYRMKQYEKALIPCNRALELNKRNGEAFVLQQLLKKKLLDKIKKRDMKKKPTKLPLVSKSEMKCITEKPSNVKPECFNDELSIMEKVRRLARLASRALHSNNSDKALMCVKKALTLYTTYDDPDENIFRQLLVLKQNVMNWNSPDKK